MQKFRRIWLMLGVFWIGVVIYLSLTPSPPTPLHFRNADKLEHALVYASVMLWFCQVFRQRMQMVLLGLLLIGMGIALEFIQRMTGYRSFEYADMLANTIGVALGGMLAQTQLGRIYCMLATAQK